MFTRAKEHFKKPITTIVNNALIDFSFDGDQRNKLDTIKWSEFETQLQGSVQAALHTLRAGYDDMKVNKFGRIINIGTNRSEEHTSELQSRGHLVCRLL